MKPSIKDVAMVAGVSATTVSRVLNNRGYISEETKKKVYKAMEEIEYYPNDIARALLNNKTNLIGLIFPMINNPFHVELISYIETILSEKGFKVLLCNSMNNPKKEQDYLTMLRRNQVDGIIVGTHNDNIPDYNIPELPVIAIDRYLGDGVVTVSCDNYGGGRLAVQSLLDNGCKNILCIRGNSKLKLPANKRSQAYIDIMNENNLKVNIAEVEFIKSIEEKFELVKEIILNNKDIDGVFAGDDLLASMVINVCEEQGIDVPKDLKVIGFDGAIQTLAYLPKLTTIKQPIKKIAEVSVDKLIRKINGEKVDNEIGLPVVLHRGKTI
ncbi:LacI family DNA-binding transcriptional regulator [Terrisporobacter sp.]|uniref:LacI family DNA-binding transcriptional regulator n=1 Tax=Terrisporobacter sp. TaxID=1965305 RepID=UPI002606C60D|nr:LacI family DNA-binding transcriptional regulator [Terrisporobacter sp.]